ncbi:MAG TPA: VOC family protein [Bryobacteraceae bacterium]|nr:VOC family protein [Bryobacteraceae bacterium]
MRGAVTYLNFDGNCRQAMQFYGKCLGAELQLMTFAEGPASLPKEAKEAKDRILHARLTKGSVCLMASDTLPGMPFQQGNNFSIALECESLEEIEKLFTAVGESGTIVMPLHDAFWGARFGMLKDQFGIHWMFSFEPPKQG